LVRACPKFSVFAPRLAVAAGDCLVLVVDVNTSPAVVVAAVVVASPSAAVVVAAAHLGGGSSNYERKYAASTQIFQPKIDDGGY